MASTSATLAQLAADAGIPLWLFLAVIAWTLTWKGIAWWRAARNGHVLWFVAFFVVHTFGILEILYVFLFSRTEFLTTFRNSKPRRKVPEVSKMKLPALASEKKQKSRQRG